MEEFSLRLFESKTTSKSYKKYVGNNEETDTYSELRVNSQGGELIIKKDKKNYKVNLNLVKSTNEKAPKFSGSVDEEFDASLWENAGRSDKLYFNLKVSKNRFNKGINKEKTNKPRSDNKPLLERFRQNDNSIRGILFWDKNKEEWFSPELDLVCAITSVEVKSDFFDGEIFKSPHKFNEKLPSYKGVTKLTKDSQETLEEPIQVKIALWKKKTANGNDYYTFSMEKFDIVLNIEEEKSEEEDFETYF